MSFDQAFAAARAGDLSLLRTILDDAASWAAEGGHTELAALLRSEKP